MKPLLALMVLLMLGGCTMTKDGHDCVWVRKHCTPGPTSALPGNLWTCDAGQIVLVSPLDCKGILQ